MRTAHLLALLIFLDYPPSASAQALPGTKPLELKGDLARLMLEGIDKYLTRATLEAEANRSGLWHPEFASPQVFEKSVQPNRDRLKKVLGVVDERVPFKDLKFVASTGQGALVAQTDLYTVQAVRWPVLPGVYGEGLLLSPKAKIRACVVTIPDADQTPEQLAGLDPGTTSPQEGQIARRLAEQGCLVLAPALVDRKDTYSGNPRVGRWTNQPHREFVYRMAYEMGRHIIGYELQKVLAAVDWFSQREDKAPIGVWGYGEGGLLAFYSGAIDPRIASTGVAGYFQHRERLDREPIYRNVWGLTKQFGDAELAALVAPRTLCIETVPEPRVKGPPEPRDGRRGAAPGSLGTPFSADAVTKEYQRGLDLSFKKIGLAGRFSLDFGDTGHPGGAEWIAKFLAGLGWTEKNVKLPMEKSAADLRKGFDSAPRQKRQFDQLVDYTQKLLPAAAQKRQDFFWSKLDTSSVEKFQKSQEPLRDYFHREIIGRLPEPSMPLNPRTRLIYETPKWKGYEVVLDVYEDVISYGILLVPNDIKPGEKRPCVVCQHGLEGRPTDVVNPNETTKYYNSFGAKLADLGFVVFAPQNPYIFGNDFRQVVRKANPLELTLYAFIYRQHQRILEFLGTLPFVDSSRIAYYGLSYGGKVAMRIPALLLGYCLSICSGDFNEWIWKNITLDWQNSYMFSIEYEMYEFDLGNTFNYAEMAALIAPRPFMVERGHNDGVGLDEYVAFEYAKVRRLYAKLGIPERTEIEFFQGGHEINLRGTLAFLRRHLHWPAK